MLTSEIQDFTEGNFKGLAENFQVNIRYEALAVLHAADEIVVHIIAQQLHAVGKLALGELSGFAYLGNAFAAEVVPAIRRFDLKHDILSQEC